MVVSLTWTCATAVSTWTRVETVATPCALPKIRFAVELEEEDEEEVVEKQMALLLPKIVAI